MNTVHAQFVGGKALLSQEELRRVLDLARRAQEIELRIENEDLWCDVGVTWRCHQPLTTSH
jgi:hypothetical protein